MTKYQFTINPEQTTKPMYQNKHKMEATIYNPANTPLLSVQEIEEAKKHWK